MKPWSSLKYDRDDPTRPYFIYSSDIHRQIVGVIMDKIVENEDEVELVEGDGVQVSVNIQLDSLLGRCKHLQVSQLINDNLICIVKYNGNDRIKMDKFKLNDNISLQLANEMWLINVVLTINLIKITKNHDINLSLSQDEMYQFCDQDMINRIKKYITCLIEGESNHVKHKNFPNISSVSSKHDFSDFQINDISDSTLDDSFVDKTFSDTCSLQELDCVDTITEFEMYSLKSHRPKFLNNRSLILGKSNKLSIDDDGFIENQNNLRHNEQCLDLNDNQNNDLLLNIDNLQQVNCDLDDYKFQNLHNLEKFNHSRKSSTTNDNFPLSLTRNMSTGYISPRRLSTKSSTNSLLVDYDDYDIEYDENNVPSYIKQNKKFKFIKVGKVQKFVSLFEEKTQDIPPSPKTIRSKQSLKY